MIESEPVECSELEYMRENKEELIRFACKELVELAREKMPKIVEEIENSFKTYQPSFQKHTFYTRYDGRSLTDQLIAAIHENLSKYSKIYNSSEHYNIIYNYVVVNE